MKIRSNSYLGRRLRHLWHCEDGVANIELAFCIPVLLMLFMASMEAGLFMVRSAMLERGLDLAMRDYRLGRMRSMDYEEIRFRVCQFTLAVADCPTNLKVWIEPVNTNTTPWTLPGRQTNASGDRDYFCGNRNQDIVAPVPGRVAPEFAAQNQIMLIRVCALEDPIFPSTYFSQRLTRDSITGRYAISTATVVVTEPI
ncbi:TadE/TadG family type IV pilus assembly protein [Pseudogemmobacter bohemicus]|uniref:TadE/TadG family type IV pilus assembly protein n=1 Tax=Pseudogemmobacter bohemicus TaxID=2250708 RepID=UPI000DD39509|nr:TadE family protein [Pseudogemmobacter bohemicus]